MKKATEDKIREKVKAWKEVQAIIVDRRKNDNDSPGLVSDLEKLAKSYEKNVFRICYEEYK